MNIFLFDADPQANASYYPDKLIVKMPLESLQLMVTYLEYKGITHNIKKKNGTPFKPLSKGHSNHPSMLWVKESKANFEYLCWLALALCEEYTKRYNKVHGCYEGITKSIDLLDSIPDSGTFTGYSYAIDDKILQALLLDDVITLDEYSLLSKTKTGHHIDLVVRIYQAYLLYAKSYYAQWRYSDTPDFWTNSKHKRCLIPDDMFKKAIAKASS